MSSKQRRGYNTATWRQTKAVEQERKIKGLQPEWQKRREARQTVARFVFTRVENHAKGFEIVEQEGYAGEFQAKAATKADELLRAWYNVLELPKQTRKPWEIIDALVFQYVYELNAFIEAEPETAVKVYNASERHEQMKLAGGRPFGEINEWLTQQDAGRELGRLESQGKSIKLWWRNFYDTVKTNVPSLDE